MKRFLLALALLFVPTAAFSQCNGVFANNMFCGNTSGSPKHPTAVGLPNFPGSTILTTTYGVSGSGTTTTGTINAGSHSLALASASDYSNSQGIYVNHAGAAFSAVSITGLTITPTGCGSCSTTYIYYVSPCDANGGYGANVNATNAAGPDNLGKNVYNQLSWTSSGTCFLIWRKIGAGPQTYIASVSATSYRDDLNSAVIPPVPVWAVSTPPSVAAADWLVTTISSGGGTTTLTLAAAATTNATTQTVMHDDTTAMNTWIAAVNSACQSGSIQPGATIRVTAPLTSINCSNITIEGNNSSLNPSGAGDGASALAVFSAFGGSSSTTLRPYCMENSHTITVSSTSGLADGYFNITEPSLVSGANAIYDFWSHDINLGTTTINLRDGCPTSFYDTVENFAIGGSVFNAGDSCTIGVSSSAITGSPLSVYYTLLGGETQGIVAHKLAVAVNNNQNLAAANVRAWDDQGSDAIVGWPHNSITVTFGQACAHGGGGNVTITATQPTSNTTLNSWTPLTALNFRDITGDGSNVAGGNSGSYSLFFLDGLANSVFSNIISSNFRSGSGLFIFEGYNNTVQNVYDTFSGNENNNAIQLNRQTRLQISNIFSEASNGFAIAIDGTWITGDQIKAIGARDRGVKWSSSAQGRFTNVSGANVGDTAMALTLGSYRNQITNWGVSQNSDAFSTNGQGLWLSDQFNQFNQLANGSAYGANSSGDVSVGLSDTNNVFYSTQASTFVDSAANTVK